MTQGQVKYTNRAFEQDGDQAMRGDIVRALVELITNADDVYRGERGSIQIEISKHDSPDFPVKVSVADSAVGLTREALLEKFATIGGRNDAFIEEEVGRGLLGRGAKDVASLGMVIFETIHDGAFATLSLKRNGEWECPEETPVATNEQRSVLGLAKEESGLKATMLLKAGINVPRTATLIARLAANCQLRDLVNRCDVNIVDKRGKQINAKIDYLAPNCTPRLETTFVPDGFNREVTISLAVLEKPSEKGLSSESPQGVLIQSGATIYENTLFGLENKPHANRICGRIVAPEINEIIRDYIRNDDGSGTSLISRSRDGLVSEHAFRRALWTSAGSFVADLIRELESEDSKSDGQGERLTNDLKDAAAALAHEFSRIQEELEVDQDGDGNVPIDADIDVVPPRIVIDMNSSQTISVRVRPGLDGKLQATVANPNTSISVTVSETVQWREHPRLELVVTNFTISSGDSPEQSVVLVKVGELAAAVEVVVRERGSGEQLPPNGLEISPRFSTVTPTRTKRLVVRAPIEFCDVQLEVVTSGANLLEQPNAAVLRPHADGNWAEATLKVRAGVELGTVLVTVSGLDSLGEASASIEIKESTQSGGNNFDIRLHRGGRTARRAVMYPDDDGIQIIRINTDHPATNGVFGRFVEAEDKYESEDSAEARLLISEVCAQTLAEHLVELDSLKRPAFFQDAQSFFHRSAEMVSRLLPIVFRALVEPRR